MFEPLDGDVYCSRRLNLNTFEINPLCGKMSIKIVKTEGVVGGNPRIEGTRVQVADVAQYYTELNWSVEKISSELDLTPDQVLEALKYYYGHSKGIREIIRARKAETA